MAILITTETGQLRLQHGGNELLDVRHGKLLLVTRGDLERIFWPVLLRHPAARKDVGVHRGGESSHDFSFSEFLSGRRYITPGGRLGAGAGRV